MAKLATLNAGDADAFTRVLAHVFEHAPWVAARAVERRPFAGVDELHDAMVAAMRAASRPEQMALIKGHPELAGKAAIAGELTADSRREQSGAGLDRLTPEEYARFHDLNAAYKAKFGFPFIVAVKGKNKHVILADFAARLAKTSDEEFATALDQIGRIARFRLDAIIEG